ncbi:hypothetical protein [Acinetobacter indicus]|nr:hypothetical protein [Acinetobacter indicus]
MDASDIQVEHSLFDIGRLIWETGEPFYGWYKTGSNSESRQKGQSFTYVN